MCQHAANLMLDMQKRGLEDYTPRFVNVSSFSFYTSSVNRGKYCISKAGIPMVTQLFADRLAVCGIPVFEVRPGIIETDMTYRVRDQYEKMIADGLTSILKMGSAGGRYKMRTHRAKRQFGLCNLSGAQYMNGGALLLTACAY